MVLGTLYGASEFLDLDSYSRPSRNLREDDANYAIPQYQ